MTKQVLQLYPHPGTALDLKNLYLDHCGWHQSDTKNPKVVANFLTSIDGRIAIGTHNTPNLHLPKNLTSKEDFRLFLELYAQADCLITHGGYMRSVTSNTLGNILQLPDSDEFADLHEWRKQQGLKPHADIVIASASLEFPMHESLQNSGQKIYIATGKKADPERCDTWKKQGYEIIQAGSTKYVEGALLIKELAKKNYKHIYLIAGPKMLHTMVQGQQLHTLYLSSSHQLLGSETFRTILDGCALKDLRLKLNSLYYDEKSENNCGQFFSSYTCSYD